MNKMNFYLGSFKILYRIAPGKVILFTASIFSNLLYTPVQLFITKAIIDRFQYGYTEELYAAVIQLTILLAVFMLSFGLFGSMNAMAISALQDIGDLEKERMIIDKSTRLNLIDAESPSIADIRAKAMKVSILQIFQDGGELLSRALVIIVLLVILTVKGHWGLTLGTCIITLLSMLIYVKSSESTEQLARRQTSKKRMMEYLFDILTCKQSVREIRVFNAADYLKEKKYTIFKKHKNETFRQGIKTEGLRLLPDIIMATAGGILAVAIVMLISSKRGNAGDFLVLFQSATMLYSSLPRFMSLTSNLKASAIRWNDFETFINLEEEEHNSKEYLEHFSSMNVETGSLTYRYPNSQKPAINNVSLKIPAGCKVAIVGENGSGKSTLVKLLLGLYKPDGGYVKWTVGQDEIPFPQVRQNSSVVFQDYARFNLTVRENIALGNISLLYDDMKLEEALHKAQVHVEVDILDSQLGASFGGLELSGGQWQRLVTSRAYLHDGIFVFFDEPTAALDPKAEERAFSIFLNMTRGKSAVLVTHRLGAARLTDYILVLKDGELVEQGTHEELTYARGEYAKMYEMQASWYT